MKTLARDAEVAPVSIEVRILTVTGQTLSLAMFKQLERSSLIDVTNHAFVGKPWGRVNCCIDAECDFLPRDHVHVVWQLNDELRRATVLSPHFRPFFDKSPYLSDRERRRIRRVEEALFDHGVDWFDAFAGSEDTIGLEVYKQRWAEIAALPQLFIDVPSDKRSEEMA